MGDEESFATFDPTQIDAEGSSKLAPQTLEGLDATKLTPLSPQVISRQATINIGAVFALII